MGILQREYESQQLISLMQTMDPQSKEYKILLMGVVANTGMSHRMDIMEMIKESIDNAAALENASTQQAVDPMQQQLQQLGVQLQVAETQAKIQELNSRSNLQNVKARNEMLEPEFRRADVLTKGIWSVEENRQERAMKQRQQYLDSVLAWEDIKSNERIAQMQTKGKVVSEGLKSRGAVATERVRERAARETARSDERARAREAGASVASAKKGEAKVVPVPVPVRPAPFVARSARVM
jgi:hypothetical protein